MAAEHIAASNRLVTLAPIDLYEGKVQRSARKEEAAYQKRYSEQGKLECHPA